MNRLPRLNEKTDDTLCRPKQETACYLSTLSSDLDLKSQTIFTHYPANMRIHKIITNSVIWITTDRTPSPFSYANVWQLEERIAVLIVTVTWLH